MAAATIIFFERKVKESLKKSNSKKILDNLRNNRQIYGHQFDNFYSFSIAHKRFYIIFPGSTGSKPGNASVSGA